MSNLIDKKDNDELKKNLLTVEQVEDDQEYKFYSTGPHPSKRWVKKHGLHRPSIAKYFQSKKGVLPSKQIPYHISVGPDCVNLVIQNINPLTFLSERGFKYSPSFETRGSSIPVRCEDGRIEYENPAELYDYSHTFYSWFDDHESENLDFFAENNLSIKSDTRYRLIMNIFCPTLFHQRDFAEKFLGELHGIFGFPSQYPAELHELEITPELPGRPGTEERIWRKVDSLKDERSWALIAEGLTTAHKLRSSNLLSKAIGMAESLWADYRFLLRNNKIDRPMNVREIEEKIEPYIGPVSIPHKWVM